MKSNKLTLNNSLHLTNIAKYKYLFNKYKDVLINLDTKSNIFYQAEKDISDYIFSTFVFLLQSNYMDRSNLEKIIIAIYYRVHMIYGKERIFEEVKNISENSFYMSLGIEDGLDSYKWNKDDPVYFNFIKHTIKKVFIPELLKYMKSLSISIDNFSDTEHHYFYENIDNSKFLSEDLKEKLINYLKGYITLEELTELDKSILEKLYM